MPGTRTAHRRSGALLLVLCLVAAACGGDDDDSDAAAAEPALTGADRQTICESIEQLTDLRPSRPSEDAPAEEHFAYIESLVVTYDAQAQALTDIANYLPDEQRSLARDLAERSTATGESEAQRLEEVRAAGSDDIALPRELGAAVSDVAVTVERECGVSENEWFLPVGSA